MLERYGHGGDLLTAEETFGREADTFLDFSSNMNPFGPPEAVKVCCSRFAEQIHRYPDPAVRRLRRKLSDLHRIPEESLLVGNGAAELIELAVRVLQPERTALARPSFSEYEEAVEKAGGRLLELPLRADRGFVLSREEAEAALPHADVFFFGHPNNPTGRLLDPGVIRSLLDGGATVILDEAFIDFHPRQEELTWIREAAESRNLLVIRSMTKFYAIPGIRLGYIAAHPDRITAMKRLQVQWSVNGLAQDIGEAVLEDREYASRTLAWLAEERPRFIRRLEETGLSVIPSDTNFVLFSLGRGPGWPDIKELQGRLGKEGILIRDASLFPGLDRSYGRLAVRRKEDNDRLADALQRCLLH
ncbi:threonine-phosphate decarboxylase CobD [Paenibacillus aurantius]|uniref:threonine-phosphate decarboxylase n=1 Tax=Paenibacillus aurantius TaxID=2918900 RepID=A0AA96REI7_9BACL|nr:threonine-phosphate decarboxylase CobD [Paenibacillus aurantius]WNQ10228.1 threonine-phosphate decarboxylase CobD [Paenibacillus aurantius]